jgi:hypothetical protein
LAINIKEEKAMKKRFAKLSKSEQQKVEQHYQQMRPDEFDRLMTRAKKSVSLARQKRRTKVAEKKRAA